MNLVKKLAQDDLLSRVVQNSAHLFSSNSVSLGFSVMQGILAARMLGPAGFGLVGIVMSYASTINGLVSFRMGELVVRYGGKYLEQGEKQRAAALIKGAGLTEMGASVIAFMLVTLTAGAGARFIAKAPGIEWMFILYGLGLLANFNSETATGVLQITNKIKVRGTINLVQSILTAFIIVMLFLVNARTTISPTITLLAVLGAYLIGKAVMGIGLFVAAWAQVSRALGAGWQQASTSRLPAARELFGFAFSSNLRASAILIFRESELLWVGLLLSSEAAGLYKVAYTVVSFLSVPADPLILSLYPETNRLIVQRSWGRLKDFLRRITLLSLSYNLLLAGGLVVFGGWILALFGEAYTVAFPAMMALLAGLVFNYVFFWNRPLLLSFGLQTYALVAVLIAGLIKVALGIVLVPRFGYLMEAVLLSVYYVISVSLIVSRGMLELKKQAART